MNHEPIDNLQNSMQFLPALMPIILLQTVEEQYPEWREVMLSAVSLFEDKRIISSNSE
jgi:hypothetical protein